MLCFAALCVSSSPSQRPFSPFTDNWKRCGRRDKKIFFFSGGRGRISEINRFNCLSVIVLVQVGMYAQPFFGQVRVESDVDMLKVVSAGPQKGRELLRDQPRRVTLINNNDKRNEI